MTIKVCCNYPPIPTNCFDYSAYWDETYDGPGCPLGYGPTAEAAIEDLIEQLAEECETDELEAKLRDEAHNAIIQKN